MKKFIRYIKLIHKLQEINPQFIICYGTGADLKIHLAQKGAKSPECKCFTGMNVNNREVYYLNGAAIPERICSECFKDHQELLVSLEEGICGA